MSFDQTPDAYFFLQEPWQDLPSQDDQAEILDGWDSMDRFFWEMEGNFPKNPAQLYGCGKMKPSPWKFNACTIINAGLIILNDDLQCVHIDENLAQVSGKSVIEYLGKSICEIFPDQTQTLKHIMQEVLNSGKPFLGYELPSKNSYPVASTHRWLVSCYPFTGQNGKTLGIDCVVLES
jgi:PAS fold